MIVSSLTYYLQKTSKVKLNKFLLFLIKYMTICFITDSKRCRNLDIVL